jgi:hypothetical protein
MKLSWLQSMLHYTGHVAQFAGQRRRIGNPPKAAIQNMMAFIRRSFTAAPSACLCSVKQQKTM